MKKVNYLSDFKLKETTERVDTSVPFVFSYFVFPTKRYEVSFDGNEYKNCFRNDDGSITVVFQDHGLDAGKLKVERKWFVNDQHFKNGVCKAVSVDVTGINLVQGKTDDVNFETVIIPPYIKGDKGESLHWNTLTEEEKSELIQGLGDEINAELITTSDTEDTEEYNDVFN